ncbi:lysophospholipid acyltransferase family protein [Pararhodobacter zhoushanensis]|uniref:1-acyl-sn-glycerol-3-phosphate acyltransferase n=1 Tax=Pararhodobacter zhoushanensis TaxID=2479545 RepID=A0ABT3GWD5_9RHOB|nr:lysophospholipid acyltransferase family protein [Pararhodobacter zhoushanensis]MCW1931856.1 1-acyl-sn-glycerol-3-phosphate acyltransferase [Pararhodobacter zhoushanensis]
MRYAIQWLRSLIFSAQAYFAMIPIALIFLPWALIDRRGAFGAVHAWTGWIRWTASWMVGLKSEIRGPIPEGEVMIAAKHQSFFDIILICSALPRPKFIMKKQLLWAPIVGWYALRIGCVPVDRGRRGAAIKGMVEKVRANAVEPGQLIIFPQGTRVAAGVSMPYKVGVGVLYNELKAPVVPVACNVGVFWPRHAVYRKPGTAVIEFLPAIEPGLPIRAFLATVEEVVETRSDALMAEAGFPALER